MLNIYIINIAFTFLVEIKILIRYLDLIW